MPEINYLFVALAGLVPMIIGSLYYGPVMGKQWMDSLGFTEKDVQGGNMPVIFGVSILFSMILAFAMKMNIELTHKEVNDAGQLVFGSFHTFKHGALHGLFTGLMLGIPALISNSLFQRNTGKNIIINVAYWLLTFTLMGGILDAWA